jgi:hypothetical protein
MVYCKSAVGILLFSFPSFPGSTVYPETVLYPGPNNPSIPSQSFESAA